MSKLQPTMLDDPPAPRRSRVRPILAIILGFALAPVVYEGALLCVANWREMGGEEIFVQTPVLDALWAGLDQTSESLRYTVGGYFKDLPWRPEYVIGAAFAWALGGGYLLRSVWR